jgi:hypothetical protein
LGEEGSGYKPLPRADCAVFGIGFRHWPPERGGHGRAAGLHQLQQRRDAALVEPVVTVLKARGIALRIDQEHLLTGESWRPALEQAFLDCTAAAVLVGPHGVGPVRREKMDVAQSQARKVVIRVLPVRLPGAGALPPFLNLKSRIDLPASLASE